MWAFYVSTTRTTTRTRTGAPRCFALLSRSPLLAAGGSEKRRGMGWSYRSKTGVTPIPAVGVKSDLGSEMDGRERGDGEARMEEGEPGQGKSEAHKRASERALRGWVEGGVCLGRRRTDPGGRRQHGGGAEVNGRMTVPLTSSFVSLKVLLLVEGLDGRRVRVGGATQAHEMKVRRGG